MKLNKKVLLNTFAIIALILSLVTPCFNLLKARVGLAATGEWMALNGFGLLGGLGIFSSETTATSAYSLLLVNLSTIWVVCLVISSISAIKALLDSDLNRAYKSLDFAFACLFIEAIIYLINGVVGLTLLTSFAEPEAELKTFSYIPIIFASIVLIGYCCLKDLFRDISEEQPIKKLPIRKEKDKKDYTDIEIIDTLARYKELLDKGVISPEEYYKAKNRILD